MALKFLGKCAVQRSLIIVAFTSFCAAGLAIGQTDAPMQESVAAHYFDFWPGTWVEVVDGKPDLAATKFMVRRSVHYAAFEEEWRLVYGGEAHESVALRAWDQVNERWMFTWVSDNGLFQVWEGVKVDGDWYIQREFEVNGETFLSRQAWIPDGEDRLVRVMQRSFDNGKSWQTRSSTNFERVENIER